MSETPLESTEHWREIEGFPRYDVSSEGRVRTKRKRKAPRILLGGTTPPMGYRRVEYIHTLVLEAFVGPRPENHQGCHNDGDTQNNSATNLRWGTSQENNADKIKHGTDRRGERMSDKLTDESIRCIRAEPEFRGVQTMLAKAFDVNPATIAFIRQGVTWKHVPQYL